MFADICLLAPSALGLQKFLGVCYDFRQDNDIMFNSLKSVYVVFRPKSYFVHLCICIKQIYVSYMKLSIWDIF